MEATEYKAYKPNPAQLRTLLTPRSSGTSVWGRGTGKSSDIANLMHTIIRTMPRSLWLITGRSYQQMLTRTLPSTIASLERLGYYRNIHYFVGRKAPDNWRWDLPIQTPLKYDHFIHFFNGTGFVLVSQVGGGGSARGLNTDGSITDESLLLDKEAYDEEVVPTIRANKDVFGHLRMHRGHFHHTSMPYGDNGRWLLDQSKYLQESYDFVSITNEMLDLQVKFIESRDRQHRLNLWEQIKKLKQQLKFFPDKNGLLYTEANVFDNLENIPLAYLQEQYTVLAKFAFLTEVLNKRPGTVERGFYPYLDLKAHSYDGHSSEYLNSFHYNLKKIGVVDSRMDGDVNDLLPLRITADFGARITTSVVAQSLPKEYRFLKGFYVKHPLLIADIVKNITTYYAHHTNKHIYFIKDNEYGDRRNANSKLTYNQEFVSHLRKAGWRVSVVDLGRIPAYDVRYLIAQDFLKVKDRFQALPLMQFNSYNCKDVLMSMSLTPIKQGRRGEILKDKTSEGRESTPAQEATHFADNFDLHMLSIGRHEMMPLPDLSELIVSGA